ncbi:alpha-2-macroglobulin-like [Lissotriton helveticus]
MWKPSLPRLCLLLGLVYACGTSPPQPHYMLLVPTVLHGTHTEKVCVVLTHLNEPLTLSVTLEHPTHNITLSHDFAAEIDLEHCWDLKVPEMETPQIAYVTLHGKGKTMEFHGRRSVLLQPSENLVFVQTDKPIYKPGQTVQFRIVSLHDDFHPEKETFPVVYIEDPQRNRVGQWRDIVTEGGLVQLSFHLASEPLQGTYKVGVQRKRGSTVEHAFSVEEYVLPKFEVNVEMPKSITIMDEHLEVNVCAKYTYGKPVHGNLTVSVCRKYRQSYSNCYGKESEAVCEEYSREVDNKGCFHEVVSTKIFQMKRSGYDDKIHVTAIMVEEGTEVEISGEASSEIGTTITNVKFLHADPYFKKGLPLHGQILLEDSTGAPLANETVTLSVGQGDTKFNYTTDHEGKACFTVDTSSHTALDLSIRVSHKDTSYCGDSRWMYPSYNGDTHMAKYFYSKSNSYVEIQPIYDTLEPGHTQEVTVHYILSAEGLGESKEVDFHYLVMSKGGIAKHGKHAIDVAHVKHGVPGSFELSLHIGTDIAPLAKMLIFAFLPCGEVIADTTNFMVAKTFDNKVNLHFSHAEGLPASHTSLNVEASPGSLCALRAVDKSVLLMKPEKELTVESVYDLLPLKDLTGYYHGGMNLEEVDSTPCVNREPLFQNGLIYYPSSLDNEKDVSDLLEGMGLKVVTNGEFRKPHLCSTTGIVYRHDAPGVSPIMLARSDSVSHVLLESAIETVRTYFPETWIWDLKTTDAKGHAELQSTIPDTITEWKASAFCLAPDTGFGLSPTTSLTAFQPFFTDMTLPYSVIRGETFQLKVTVFNYLDQCIRVSIHLDKSEDYHAKPTKKEEEGYCIPANERVTVSWDVSPKTLGDVNFTVSAETLKGEGLCGNQIVAHDVHRKDTVVKPLLVEPEGIEKEDTVNALICVKAGSPVSEKIHLKVPENMVEGSARAYYSVVGDLMGTVIQNLHHLLQMPCGCGEQNIALLTPNIYVLDYLNKTGQLTDELKSKATEYLISGYQKQLRFKHSDGSYSAFGPPGQGNTWLTAFVLKSFAQARHHIFIEEKQLSEPLHWLASHQKDNGCFQSVGTLFNNALKGGVNDDTALAAYVTIALLEYPLPSTHPVVRNALFCLETAYKEANDVYTKALMAYAFGLAGKDDKRKELLVSLDKEAIVKDGSVHWHRTHDNTEEEHVPFFRFRPRAPSAEVELASYVLLARLAKHPVSQEDLTEAAKIVQWVTKQQNPTGAFSSTQDTVVALHGLANYGAATYVKNGESSVAVSHETKAESHFHVDDHNRLLLQRAKLSHVPGDYTVEVKGTGCVYTQSTLRYNIPHPTGDAPFDLHVWTKPDICNHKSEKTFEVHVNVSYVGKRPSSNMAVVDVKMPSGFIPVKSTVKMLDNWSGIGRTEVHPNNVIIYLEHVSNATISFWFSVEQDFEVNHRKPAMVTITDYYETDEFAVEDYSTPCGPDPHEHQTHH